MRFGDFLKATVLLSAASATLLAALTVIGIGRQLDTTPAYVCAGWWVIATLIGTRMGAIGVRLATLAPDDPQRARLQHEMDLLQKPMETLNEAMRPLIVGERGLGAEVH